MQLERPSQVVSVRTQAVVENGFLTMTAAVTAGKAAAAAAATALVSPLADLVTALVALVKVVEALVTALATALAWVMVNGEVVMAATMVAATQAKAAAVMGCAIR